MVKLSINNIEVDNYKICWLAMYIMHITLKLVKRKNFSFFSFPHTTRSMHEKFSCNSFSYITWWIPFDFKDNLTVVKIEERDIFRPVRRISIFCISKKKYFWFFAKHIHKNGENVLGNKILFEKRNKEKKLSPRNL